MLYSLFTHFSNVLGARLFTYISFRAITAGILGLLISIWFGNWFINYMKRHNISETQRDEKTDPFNVGKKGVPTMGGLIVIAAILIPCLLLGKLTNVYMILMIVTTLLMGALGFADDYIKTFKKNKDGLNGWVKIGAWVQQGGYYREGYVKKDMLQVIRPNTSYGAVLDKKAQTMTVYADGHPIGTMAVSTGYTDGENRRADTHSGVYLLGTRMKDFRREGFVYRYPIRIDGPNLIHSVGYQEHNRVKDYSEQIATLGQNVSHGCVRMDIRGEINAWWVWTHMGKDCKIIITPGT